MNATSVITKETFLQLATIITEHSSGKIRIAFNEKDSSKEQDLEAAHFLKLNEQRIGRDMELYGLMSVASPQNALIDFLELIMFIKNECKESYEQANPILKELGTKVFTGETLEKWNYLF